MSATRASWTAAISNRELLLGRDTVKRMSELFIEEAETLLASARKASQSNDLDALRRLMHHLGGSAGSLDLAELADLAQRAEQACLARDRESAAALLERASATASQSARDLQQRFDLS